MSLNSPVSIVNVNKWIADNEGDFSPPVCNKLMHNQQLTIMFVGGPNIRKDYHLEEGEELFYQIKGDMCLKIVEQNQLRDVIIKEGEMFLLPARIPHSPNRLANTVGFVMERKRDQTELDCLRYYIDKTTNRLFERWFHTTDLAIQLPVVIREFFASDECRTGQPKEDSYPKNPPVPVDEKTAAGEPFSLNQWLVEHQTDLSQGHPINLFPDKYQTQVLVIPQGQHSIDCSKLDIWLWQHQGHSKAKITTPNSNNIESIVHFDQSDSLYLDKHSICELNVNKNGIVLAIGQDPTRKSTNMAQ